MAKIFVDAYADMFGEELEKNGLMLAPSKIVRKNQVINFTGYDSKPGTPEQLIQRIRKGEYRDQPLTQQEWIDFFTPFMREGEDVLFFTVSQKLMADGGEDLRAAFTQLNETFSPNKAYLIDTCTVSRGTSEIAALCAVVLRRDNDIEAMLQFANDLTGSYVSVFVLDNPELIAHNPLLNQLSSHLSGTLVNVKPIISIDRKGNFALLDKAKGFKAAVRKLVGIAEKNGENIADFTFSIAYFDAEEEAKKLYEDFLKVVDNTEIRLVPISLNTAVMIGGKVVGLTFHSK